MKRLNFFHATLKLISADNTEKTINVVDQFGHPYISRKIFMEQGYVDVIVLWWTEITEDEYDYWWATND